MQEKEKEMQHNFMLRKLENKRNERLAHSLGTEKNINAPYSKSHNTSSAIRLLKDN